MSSIPNSAMPHAKVHDDHADTPAIAPVADTTAPVERAVEIPERKPASTPADSPVGGHTTLIRAAIGLGATLALGAVVAVATIPQRETKPAKAAPKKKKAA